MEYNDTHNCATCAHSKDSFYSKYNLACKYHIDDYPYGLIQEIMVDAAGRCDDYELDYGKMAECYPDDELNSKERYTALKQV